MSSHTSLRELLLTAWKQDPENAIDPRFLSGPPPTALCHSDNPFTVLQDDQSQVRQQLLDSCEQYALNYLPTHLLRISDLALVTRAEFWDVEKHKIERQLTEDPQMFVRSVQGDVTDSTASDDWRLRTRRGDEIVEIRRDAYIRSLFKFAIFSHRWGEGEPQFHDTMNGYMIEKQTAGYEKLRSFCAKAKSDFSCCYAWSDTCCINKESSVELDEAIRSMYRWYSIATVCIVHLAKSRTIYDFGSEPWFTRGWTLQELLAPQVIRFYGCDWHPIWQPETNLKGDKAIKEIRTAIERVTGIPHDDLRHFLPSCDRVAEKMKWASQRQTTKIEDMAYSLLGLFNVSLPIAYGEADRAWYRLMGAIANECTDASFFAWAGRSSPYSRALPSSAASYLNLDLDQRSDVFNRRHPSYEVSKLGVVIKMLVIPARCSVLEDVDGREIGYSVTPHHLERFLVGADVLHGHVEEYKLGIVNFRSRGDITVEANDECHCLVLARERSDDQGWIMVNAECVIVVRCLEEITQSPETVLLYHTNSGFDAALLRRAHRYNPVVETTD